MYPTVNIIWPNGRVPLVRDVVWSKVMWVSELSVESPAATAAVWKVLADIAGWPTWNPDFEKVEADGPLAVGTTVMISQSGLPPAPARVTELTEGRSFTVTFDMGGEDSISVDYRVAEWSGTTRIYYRIAAQGPNDQAIGQSLASAVADQIPQSLRNLSAAAQGA